MPRYLFVFLASLSIALGALWFMGEQATAPELDQAAAVPQEETDTLEVQETPEVPAAVLAAIAEMADRIVLSEPVPLTLVANPLVVKGEARGMWFFEGSFPVTVVNWDGLIIGEGIATADGEWMTEEFVPFTASVAFTREPDAYSKRGTLILRRDNPSGLPEYDAALEIPIILP